MVVSAVRCRYKYTCFSVLMTIKPRDLTATVMISLAPSHFPHCHTYLAEQPKGAHSQVLTQPEMNLTINPVPIANSVSQVVIVSNPASLIFFSYLSFFVFYFGISGGTVTIVFSNSSLIFLILWLKGGA